MFDAESPVRHSSTSSMLISSKAGLIFLLVVAVAVAGAVALRYIFFILL